MAFLVLGIKGSAFLVALPGVGFVRFAERDFVLVAPGLILGPGFLAGDFQCQVVQGVLERRIVVLALAAPFLDRALHPFLLAAIVLVQLVPQSLSDLRVRRATVGFAVVGKRDRRMFRGPLQNAMDLGGD